MGSSLQEEQCPWATHTHSKLQGSSSAAGPGLQGEIEYNYATWIQLSVISMRNESNGYELVTWKEKPLNLIGFETPIGQIFHTLWNNQFIISKVRLLCDHQGATSETQSLLYLMSTDLLSAILGCILGTLQFWLVQMLEHWGFLAAMPMSTDVKLPKYSSARQSFQKSDIFVATWLPLLTPPAYISYMSHSKHSKTLLF